MKLLQYSLLITYELNLTIHSHLTNFLRNCQETLSTQSLIKNFQFWVIFLVSYNKYVHSILSAQYFWKFGAQICEAFGLACLCRLWRSEGGRNNGEEVCFFLSPLINYSWCQLICSNLIWWQNQGVVCNTLAHQDGSCVINTFMHLIYSSIFSFFSYVFPSYQHL